MSAKRFTVSVAAGERASQHFPWAIANGGGLEWNVVVLDGLTVDLKVSARIQMQDSPRASSKVLPLQETKNSRGFHGSFEPLADDRLLGPTADPESRAQVVEIIFDINNTFSWFTGKQIEIVAADTPPPGPPPAKVPALPKLEPHSPAPHNDSVQTDTSATCMVLPELLAPGGTWKTTLIVLCECLATQLDTWLSTKQLDASHTVEIEWFVELHKRVMELRDFSQCKVEEERQAFEVKMKEAIANKAEEARLTKETLESAKKAERERLAEEVAEAKASAVQKAEEERLARKAAEDALKAEEKCQAQEVLEGAAIESAEEEHLASESAEAAQNAESEYHTHGSVAEDHSIRDGVEIEKNHPTQETQNGVAMAPIVEAECAVVEIAEATPETDREHQVENKSEVSGTVQDAFEVMVPVQTSEDQITIEESVEAGPEKSIATEAEGGCLIGECAEASQNVEEECQEQEVLEAATIATERAEGEQLSSATAEKIQKIELVGGHLVQGVGTDLM